MSSALYTIRLLWNGRLGLAKAKGVTVELAQWPAAALPGVHVAEIEYTPEVRYCEVLEVREMSSTWRRMTREECMAIKAWLERMADAAHAATQADPLCP